MHHRCDADEGDYPTRATCAIEEAAAACDGKWPNRRGSRVETRREDDRKRGRTSFRALVASVAHNIASDKFASLRGHTTRQIGKYEITNGNYQKPEEKYAHTLPI